MPVFSYKGVGSQGKRVTGVIDAENIKAARVKLRKQQVFPTDIREGGSRSGLSSVGGIDFKKYFEKVKIVDVANMTRQLATLVNANIPLVDSLTALVEQTENEKLKSALSEIRERVKEGGRLADAMRPYPKIFSDLYINMVQAGELSGALDVVLLRLAEFTEGQNRLRSKVKGAVMYPIIMAVFAVGLMIFLLIFLVPKIVSIFENTKATLPLPTRVLIGLSSFVTNYWFVAIILIVGLFFALRYFKKKPQGRLLFDRLKLKLPIFGDMFRMISISRFARTLSTLMKSGVRLMPALGVVKGVVENVVLVQVIEDTQNSVKEGESIAGPLRRSEQFPPIVTHMISLGEKTGELETMLERIADNYEDQVETRVSTLTTLLEPLMIVVMGVVVGGMVISVMLPILQLNKLIR